MTNKASPNWNLHDSLHTWLLVQTTNQYYLSDLSIGSRQWPIKSTIWIFATLTQLQECREEGREGGREGGRRGAEWEERREESWGVVRDIPFSLPATWVFHCFNKAEFGLFKERAPPVTRREQSDPSLRSEPRRSWSTGRPGSAAGASMLTRQVACLSAPLRCCSELSPRAPSN